MKLVGIVEKKTKGYLCEMRLRRKNRIWLHPFEPFFCPIHTQKAPSTRTEWIERHSVVSVALPAEQTIG